MELNDIHNLELVKRVKHPKWSESFKADRSLEITTLLGFLKPEIEFVKENLYCGYYEYMIQEPNYIRITTAYYEDKEIVDSIQRPSHSVSPYHEFINGLLLWDILTDEGRRFFIRYYKPEIQQAQLEIKRKACEIAEILKSKRNELKELQSDYKILKQWN